jgi:hypothetical protein
LLCLQPNIFNWVLLRIIWGKANGEHVTFAVSRNA